MLGAVGCRVDMEAVALVSMTGENCAVVPGEKCAVVVDG
jgi:hypothetical protein